MTFNVGEPAQCEKKATCEVCNKPTNNCPSSPFLPCSYWRCPECVMEHRIAYWELLCVASGNGYSGTRKFEKGDEDGKVFDPKTRCWTTDYIPPSGPPKDFDEVIQRINDNLSCERVPNYGDHYLLSTLKFFGVSKEKVWAERNDWMNHQRDSLGKRNDRKCL